LGHPELKETDMRRRTLIRLASASALVGPTTARAQAYPTKSLTIVAPYSAGGPTDTLSRILAEHMQPVLGQTILIENVTGAGAAPAMQDLLAGQIDLMIDQAANCLPHLRAGKIKAYAVAAPDRLAALPDIPTADQAGLAGFHSAVWHAMWAPAATPGAIIERL